VRLRPFERRDLSLVAELSSDPYVPLIGSIPAIFTEAEGLAYLERQAQRLTDGQGYSYAIADRETDVALGGAGLWLHGAAATAGYAVAPRARGRGVATAALCALTRFAWSLLQVRTVELFIEPWNLASIRVAERSGYTFVERHLRHSEIGGKRRDMLRYAVRRGP
jgi:RimJ/RimL family protein N-acetyltransferase